MKIGILGGGQLGRMLFEASQKLAPQLEPSIVYHDSAHCPAGFGGATVVEGAITDSEKLTAFFRDNDTFAIESEFLPLEPIEASWERAGKPVSTPRPSKKSLAIAQDKLEQKKFFTAHHLPTSEFTEITESWFDPGSNSLATLHQQWQGLVLKTARMGYDGKGNLALPPQDTALGQAAGFCRSAYQKNSRVYAEKFVAFEREVALVCVRTHTGNFGHYPLIETVQKNGVCLLAFNALQSEKLERQAAEIARIVGEKLDLLGTYAVEFFVTTAGELLVNEMAPRVHNSGHFSQTAARFSQFSMHLKSYRQKKWEASEFECAPAFAMINLLGPPGLHQRVTRPQQPGVYWYDKEMTSPGRKLGHIILQSSAQSDLPDLIKALKAGEHSWQESLRP